MDDRPAHEEDEIEVTPEMIEAGALAYTDYDPRFEGIEDVAIRVYIAMTRVNRRKTLRQPASLSEQFW